LSDEERAAWVEALSPVWDEFSGDVGEDLIKAASSGS